MRILHLDSGAEMRGGQWQVLRLIEGLGAAGHESTLLARGGSPLYVQARNRGMDVHAWSYLAILRRSGRADIVHAHDARSHTAAALAAAGRLVVSRRVAFSVKRNPASRWKYSRAAHFIAVSQYVKCALVEAGIETSKITMVYDGVPSLPLSHGSEILTPDSDDPAKGTALAIQGAKLAGLPVRPSGNVEADLAHAGLFLYITHSEGLGSAVLLAMSAGVPVIASDVGGLPEIVIHERTGLLTENAPEAIATAVRRLVDDRTLSQALADQARSAVQQKFSVERMVAETVRVYEAVA
ncbi:MAG: glycosyl transferase, group 1 [Bryobacterales bacterium]|nr:glycosyl transferase, group 1 [Bryobacterales bacterium]